MIASPVPLHWTPPYRSPSPLAKPNYSFEKRQRELAKKKKKEEKLARKQDARGDAPADANGEAPAQGSPESGSATG